MKREEEIAQLRALRAYVDGRLQQLQESEDKKESKPVDKAALYAKFPTLKRR